MHFLLCFCINIKQAACVHAMKTLITASNADTSEMSSDEHNSCSDEFSVTGKVVQSHYMIYYALFHKIKLMDESENDNLSKSEENAYRCIQFVDYLVKYLLSYVPLWFAVIFGCTESSLNRVSNSNVERWFSMIKNDVLEGQRNIKIY